MFCRKKNPFAKTRGEEKKIPNLAELSQEYKNLTIKQTGSKVVAQPVAEVVAKYQQTDRKVVAKNTFFALSGIQKELLEVLYSSCRNMGQKVTQKLSIQYLKEQVNKDTGTTKNAVHRLIKKHLISKYQFKNGRGGWVQFEIPEIIYNALLQSERECKPNAQLDCGRLFGGLLA